MLKTDKLDGVNYVCLISIPNESLLWYRRLGHASMSILDKLAKKKLVNVLPELKFEKDSVCDACQIGKKIRTSFKIKGVVLTTRPLELIHLICLVQLVH